MQFHAINAINRNRKLQTSQKHRFMNRPKGMHLPGGKSSTEKSKRTEYLLRNSTRMEYWVVVASAIFVLALLLIWVCK